MTLSELLSRGHALSIVVSTLTMVACGATPTSPTSPTPSALVSVPTPTPIDAPARGAALRFCGIDIPLDTKEIDCDGETIDDLSPLARFSLLEKLSLRFTRVVDVAALSRLSKLRELEITGCRTSDEVRRYGCFGDEKPNPAIGFVPRPAFTPLTDVSALAGLTALEVVHLDRTRITSIDALAGLPRLRELTISGTQVRRVPPMPKSLETFVAEGVPIEDAEGLADLPRLATLHLTFSRLASLDWIERDTAMRDLRFHAEFPRLESLAPLGPLVALETLDLSSLSEASLAPLANKTRLRSLEISDASVTHVGALATLTALERLHLDAWDFSRRGKVRGEVDLAPLEKLGGLVELELGGNPGSLAPLGGLTKLERVTLRGDLKNWIDFDVAPLAHAKSLRTLRIEEGEPSRLADVGALTSLESLRLTSTRSASLAPLAKLTRLRELRVEMWGALDPAPLASLGSLEDLSLDGKAVGSLAPLAKLTQLRTLHLASEKDVLLDPISRLTSLASLDLGATPVADLTPIGGLTGLHALHVGSPLVSDLSPIGRLTALERLTLDAARAVRSLDALAPLEHLAHVSIASAPLSTLGPLAEAPSLASLFLSGTNVRRDEERAVLVRLGGCRTETCAAWADLRKGYRHAYR